MAVNGPYVASPQVLLDAFDQQRRDGVHGSGDVRLEHVPREVLGLLPRRRLLQEAVRGGALWWSFCQLSFDSHSALVVDRIFLFVREKRSNVGHTKYFFINVYSTTKGC